MKATAALPPHPNRVRAAKLISNAISDVKIEEIKRHICNAFGSLCHQALEVSKCESGFNPYAANRLTTARGIFQFLEGTWISNRKAMGRSANLDLRFDPKESADTAAFLYKHRGWQPWSECSGKLGLLAVGGM